jgi:predicted peptidase
MNMPKEISVPERLTMLVLDSLQRVLSADANRIYITGLSMGGFGTWDLISRYPGKFACAVPLCGGGDEKMAPRLSKIPIWAFHGDADKVVMPWRSTNMVAAINAAGGNAKLTFYKGGTHNCWDATYRNPDVFRWMFRQIEER